MGMQIASTMTVDSASTNGGCNYPPLALLGSPTPQPADKKIYVEGVLLQYYNNGATPKSVPGGGLTSCPDTPRFFRDDDLIAQKVRWHDKPIALLGDSVECGASGSTRALTGPYIGATIHIGTRRSVN